MTQEKILYKSIEKWAQRPGCIATATVLSETEANGPVEVDIYSKEEAVSITQDLVNVLTIWIRHHEEILSKVPPALLEYIWNSDRYNYVYNNTAKELDIARKEQMKLIFSYYPARSMVNNLNQMKKDRDNYEKLFTYFNSL